MKNLKATVQISRYTSSSGPDGITITVQDQNSRVLLCELELTLAQFAGAVTGLAAMDVPCESLADDQRLGVVQKTEIREAFCPKTFGYEDGQEGYKKWLTENVVLAEGEESSFYLGIQGSVVPHRKPDGTLLRYTVRSWPKEPACSPE